jgi:hypothetical protein
MSGANQRALILKWHTTLEAPVDAILGIVGEGD